MRYEAPNSLDQAVALLAGEPGEARVLAGGTDLLVQLRTDLIAPVLVVDIKGIAETRQIKEEGGGFRIGAAVTGAELKEHPRLKAVWPGVVEAANLIGSTQVQGRASMGGNLCNGSPAADSVPALIAAGAKCSIVGPKGRRELAVEHVDVAAGQALAQMVVGPPVAEAELEDRARRQRARPRRPVETGALGLEAADEGIEPAHRARPPHSAAMSLPSSVPSRASSS